MVHQKYNKCPYCGSNYACDCWDRIRCREAGKIGHQQCGWCVTHDKPRFQCSCLAKEEKDPMSLLTGEYWAAVEAKADKWVPACGGTEEPMLCNGSMWLYVFNPAKQKHGWLNLHTDIVHNEHPNLTIEERKVLP